MILFRLEIKRTLKSMPKFLISGLVLGVIITMLALGANETFGRNRDEDAKAKFAVAVVSDEDTYLMDYAKSIVLSTKSINTSVNLMFTNEEEADELIDKNQVVAEMIIPEQVVDDIISGINNPIRIKFPENPGYEAAVFREIAQSAVEMLSAAQAGVYSAYDYYRELDKIELIEESKDRLNDEYIKSVLLREGIYDDVSVLVTEDMTVIEYYILSGIIVFFMLFGINYISITGRFLKEISMRLYQYKMGPFIQVMSKIIALAMVYLMFSFLGGGILLVTGIMDIIQVLKVIAGIVPIIICVSSIIICIFHIFENRISSIIFLFIYTMIQGFMTGALLPRSMLPDGVIELSKFTPGHYLIKEINIIFTQSGNIILNTLVILAMALFFMMVGSVKLIGGRK